MKQRSAINATLLAVFIPFYIIYWLYVTGQELRRRSVPQVPRVLMLFAPIILLFVMLLIVMGAQSTGNTSTGLSIVSTLVGMIGVVLSIVFALLYYVRFSKAIAVATGKDISTLLIILFLFVSPAGVYVAQEKLNEASDNGSDLAPPVSNGQPADPPYPSATPAETPTPPEATPPSSPVSS